MSDINASELKYFASDVRSVMYSTSDRVECRGHYFLLVECQPDLTYSLREIEMQNGNCRISHYYHENDRIGGYENFSDPAKIFEAILLFNQRIASEKQRKLQGSALYVKHNKVEYGTWELITKSVLSYPEIAQGTSVLRYTEAAKMLGISFRPSAAMPGLQEVFRAKH